MLNSLVGSFTSNTVTGNQAITGVGFAPKVIILFSNNATADGSGASAITGMGLGISSSSRAAVCYAEVDNTAVSTEPNQKAVSATNIIYMYTGVNVAFLIADLVSLDTDGFTINFSTVQASGQVVNFIALGGSDLTNVAIKQFTGLTSPGSQALTGVGFKPDAIITVIGKAISTDVLPLHGTTGGGLIGLGFGTASSTEANSGAMNDTGTAEEDARAQAAKIINIARDSISGLDSVATLTSFDSDGFTLNYTTAVRGYVCFALCLKGGQYKVGTITQKVTTGAQATTGIGFLPTGLLLTSINNVATAAVVTDNLLSFGAGSAASNRGSIWNGSKGQAVTTTNVSHNLDRTKIIKMMTYANASPTTQSSADLTSLDSDGFTLNWSIADATAREIIYLAIGSSAITTKTLAALGVG